MFGTEGETSSYAGFPLDFSQFPRAWGELPHRHRDIDDGVGEPAEE